MAYDHWQPGLASAVLSARFFDGRLVLFAGLDPLDRLVGRARALVEEGFGDAPTTAERGLSAAAFSAAAVAVRRAVAEDAEINGAWRDTLAAIGFAPETIYSDRMRLRVVPSRAAVRSVSAMPLQAHRDTWGSGAMAQVNWWLCLYPVAATRTMVIWPGLFRQPVDNTSGDWDFDALMAARREGRDYPQLPVARTPPAADQGEAVVIEPGTLLGFSGAHLHGSAVDDSGITRFGLDTRTLWQDDIAAGRAAANVDGAGGQVHGDWFRRLSDGEPAPVVPGG